MADLQSFVRHSHNADVGFYCAERVVCRLRFRVLTQSIEHCRLQEAGKYGHW